MKRFAAILLLLLALPAHAERYRIDLIVFADKTGVGDESPLAGVRPNVARTIDPADAAKLRAAGIELVAEAQFGLMSEWRKLANSQRQQPLLRLAWIQADPPERNGPGLRLRHGSPLAAADASGGPIYPVEGAVTLLMGRFLHLDADLTYTVLNSNGEPRSWRLDERRRMRRNELHHLDSPRLGLLARIEKVK